MLYGFTLALGVVVSLFFIFVYRLPIRIALYADDWQKLHLNRTGPFVMGMEGGGVGTSMPVAAPGFAVGHSGRQPLDAITIAVQPPRTRVTARLLETPARLSAGQLGRLDDGGFEWLTKVSKTRASVAAEVSSITIRGSTPRIYVTNDVVREDRRPNIDIMVPSGRPLTLFKDDVGWLEERRKNPFAVATESKTNVPRLRLEGRFSVWYSGRSTIILNLTYYRQVAPWGPILSLELDGTRWTVPRGEVSDESETLILLMLEAVKPIRLKFPDGLQYFECLYCRFRLESFVIPNQRVEYIHLEAPRGALHAGRESVTLNGRSDELKLAGNLTLNDLGQGKFDVVGVAQAAVLNGRSLTSSIWDVIGREVQAAIIGAVTGALITLMLKKGRVATE